MENSPLPDAAAAPAHSPEEEQRRHAYRTNRIPWYVHVLWVGFWLFAMTYVILYLLPAIQSELAPPR